MSQTCVGLIVVIAIAHFIAMLHNVHVHGRLLLLLLLLWVGMLCCAHLKIERRSVRCCHTLIHKHCQKLVKRWSRIWRPRPAFQDRGIPSTAQHTQRERERERVLLFFIEMESLSMQLNLG